MIVCTSKLQHFSTLYHYFALWSKWLSFYDLVLKKRFPFGDVSKEKMLTADIARLQVFKINKTWATLRRFLFFFFLHPVSWSWVCDGLSCRRPNLPLLFVLRGRVAVVAVGRRRRRRSPRSARTCGRRRGRNGWSSSWANNRCTCSASAVFVVVLRAPLHLLGVGGVRCRPAGAAALARRRRSGAAVCGHRPNDGSMQLLLELSNNTSSLPTKLVLLLSCFEAEKH